MSAISVSLQKRVLAVSLEMLRSAGRSSNNFANRQLSPFLSLGEHFVKLIEHFVSVSANSCQIECFVNDRFFFHFARLNFMGYLVYSSRTSNRSDFT